MIPPSPNAPPELSSADLSAWSKYIHEQCGVFLDQTKGYLIETRLMSLLRQNKYPSWASMLQSVKSDGSGKLRNQVIDAITTNETSFFRDSAPFELLQHKIFPDLIDRRRKAGIKPVPIRVLSAACSTGQEAYSTAIVLKELLGSFTGYDIRILGLDISDSAIAQASYAHYSRLELERGLKPELLDRYFEPAGDRWKVKDELRALASFRKANLLEPIETNARFDLIFCRNVAIYFSENDKIRLFHNLKRSLAPDGAFIIGATESISGLCPEFKPQRYLRSVFYTILEAGTS